MHKSILAMELRYEHDVVQSRQQARHIAELLGYDRQDQTRIVTAVSEIARNAFEYAGGGKIEFMIEDGLPQFFLIMIKDKGGGIQDLEKIFNGTFMSKTGLGLGISGTKKLMDRFDAESNPQGSKIIFGKKIPKKTGIVSDEALKYIRIKLNNKSLENPFQEIQAQNQDLLKTLGELELQRELRELFVASLSHDLRTPLTSAKLAAEIILRKGGLPDPTTKLVSRITDSLNRANNMITDLLDANRIRAGEKLKVNAIRCDLITPIKESLSELSLMHGEDRFELYVNEESMVGNWDVSAMKRLIDNLGSNAIKYGAENTVVRISLTHELDVNSISVLNLGKKLTEQEIEKLFIPYHRTADAESGEQRGWGLGLTLVLGIVQAHAGDIKVTSTDAGTEFKLTFPA